MPSTGELLVLLFLICSIPLCTPSAFVDQKYEQINEYLNDLSGSYGEIKSASEIYGIAAANQGSLSCSPLIARISHMPSLKSDSLRPQILISGEIHGDERVGPSASLSTAQLLVYSSECLISKDAARCSQLRNMTNITPAQMNWLAFLSTRRDSIVIPTANCLGYIQCVRNDAGVDPNRDFPYSRSDNRCMMSTTARIFDHVMRSNLIQLVVTFHAGMVALGYEWGSKNHMAPRDGSPDDSANRELGNLMSSFGGAFQREKAYPVGRINSMVYPVDGGMEDWLYAAGWDQAPLRTDCLGMQHKGKQQAALGANSAGAGGGGPQRGNSSRNHSRHRRAVLLRGRNLRNHSSSSNDDNNNSSSSSSSSNSDEGRRTLAAADKSKQSGLSGGAVAGNRALVFLVETSNKKVINDRTLGDFVDILDNTSPRSGHVPRNVRLNLLAIDMLQPYVCIRTVASSASASATAGTGATTSAVKGHMQQHRHHRQHHSDSGHNNSLNGTLTSAQLSRSLADAVENRTASSSSVTVPQSHKVKGTNSQTVPAVEAISVEWFVGGSTTVDHTFLAWHQAPVVGSSTAPVGADWTAHLDRLSTAEATRRFDEVVAQPHRFADSGDASSNPEVPIIASKPQSGFSRWKPPVTVHGAADSDTVSIITSQKSDERGYAKSDPLRPLSSFRASATPPAAPGRYWLVVWAAVDARYGEKGQGQPADLGPQSHYINARTNPDWHFQAEGRRVQGRRYWPSDPVVVVVRGDGTHFIESRVLHCSWWDREVLVPPDVAGEVDLRVGDSTAPMEPAAAADTELSYEDSPSATTYALIDQSYNQFALMEQHYFIALVVLLVSVSCCLVLVSSWRRSRIYSSLLNNKYINMNLSGSSSSLERMRIVTRTGGLSNASMRV